MRLEKEISSEERGVPSEMPKQNFCEIGKGPNGLDHLLIKNKKE